MKSKWNCTLYLTTLLLQSSLLSWGTQGSPDFEEEVITPRPTAAELNFPLSDNQRWFAEGSFLYWRPYEDEIDYGARVSFLQNTDSEIDVKVKMKKPQFDWNSGVRIGGGIYLPDHEFWDLSVFGTYYYNDGSSRTSPNPNQNTLLDPSWNLAILGPSFKSSVKTQLNLFIIDLAAGRYFSLTPWVILHPFIGVRGNIISQSYTNNNLSQFSRSTDSASQIFILKTGFKAHNDFYGAGPRIGTDLAFQFGKGWSIKGNFSASFLWTHYAISEKINGHTFLSGQGKVSLLVQTLRMKMKDKADGLKTNLEGYIGIGWETWNKNHTVRMAPSLQFEISEWFAINHWSRTFNTGQLNPATPGTAGVKSKRQYADLGFRGFSFNLQADF